MPLHARRALGLVGLIAAEVPPAAQAPGGAEGLRPGRPRVSSRSDNKLTKPPRQGDTQFINYNQFVSVGLKLET